MSESERLLWGSMDYTYSPSFILEKIKGIYKDKLAGVGINLITVDRKEFPFTLEQIEKFLESCASLMLFLQKNNVPISSASSRIGVSEYEVEAISRIAIEYDPHIGFNSIDNYLKFSPDTVTNKVELFLDSYLKNVVELDLEDRVVREDEANIVKDDNEVIAKSRTFNITCTAGPFSEQDIDKFKYYPASVGYDMVKKEINLKRFSILKEIKKEDYPLYLNMPYVQDFVIYQYT